MSIRAILAAAALCAGATAAWADEPQHCGLMLATSLDITYDGAGGPTVPVSINGQSRQMLLDTGGLYSMLTDTAATDLGLHQSPVQDLIAHMFNGEFIGYTAMAKNFSIGSVHYEAYNFSILSPQTDSAGSFRNYSTRCVRSFRRRIRFRQS